MRFGLRPVADGEEWDVYWTDTSILLERVLEMKRYQVNVIVHEDNSACTPRKLFCDLCSATNLAC